MTGVAICEVERTRAFTQRAASGHTAMPPASAMNSRRFIGVSQPDYDEGNPAMIPLVLFEDPDVLELRIARLKNAHLLNTP
jgi:hypothetical protein